MFDDVTVVLLLVFRSLKLTGIPVLFIPGNAGSHKQGTLSRLP